MYIVYIVRTDTRVDLLIQQSVLCTVLVISYVLYLVILHDIFHDIFYCLKRVLLGFLGAGAVFPFDFVRRGVIQGQIKFRHSLSTVPYAGILSKYIYIVMGFIQQIIQMMNNKIIFKSKRKIINYQNINHFVHFKIKEYV